MNTIMSDFLDDIVYQSRKLCQQFKKSATSSVTKDFLQELVEMQLQLEYFIDYIKMNEMTIKVCYNNKTIIINCFFEVVNVICDFSEKEEKAFFENIKESIDGMIVFDMLNDSHDTYFSFSLGQDTRFQRIATIIELFYKYTK